MGKKLVKSSSSPSSKTVGPLQVFLSLLMGIKDTGSHQTYKRKWISGKRKPRWIDVRIVPVPTINDLFWQLTEASFFRSKPIKTEKMCENGCFIDPNISYTLLFKKEDDLPKYLIDNACQLAIETNTPPPLTTFI